MYFFLEKITCDILICVQISRWENYGLFCWEGLTRGIYCRKVLKTRDRNHAVSQASEENILNE